MGRILVYARPSHLDACQKKTQRGEEQSFDGAFFHGVFSVMGIEIKPSSAAAAPQPL